LEYFSILRRPLALGERCALPLEADFLDLKLDLLKSFMPRIIT
jgi:hypothetical protein